MKVSVAMATYNGANYIEEQLDSILMQTRAVDEVIICDDCSKDQTVTIVKEYINNHQLQNHWSIEVNTENIGYGSNFVQAIMKTTGDIIFFCDQDDIWAEDRVDIMTTLMEENKHILMLGSEFEPYICSEDAPSIPSWELARLKGNNELEHLKLKEKNMFIGCEGCSMCIRKNFFCQILPYWYKGWAHDEFVWKMSLCMDGAYVYHGITLKRRLHSSNVTMHKMRDLNKRVIFLEDLLRSHEVMMQFAKDLKMNKEAIGIINRNIISVKLRIELLRDKKYFNTLKLCIWYFNCYHSQKSIPVELYMSLKG
ncbi:glycosyltransferase [Anaeromicropila herbilytica]|uniref:Glycosyl transferase family 2 n=1 Tax=Anaeromicropila herbilytica TaxID=2785025 RepID=A0A7R7IBP7_9FIRM|nr:glycosyltransferase [Anaeromicropila herbilytica]BCN29016.1 glycosyl transferase family 2 [Anaeromicropila herbilytica]